MSLSNFSKSDFLLSSSGMKYTKMKQSYHNTVSLITTGSSFFFNIKSNTFIQIFLVYKTFCLLWKNNYTSYYFWQFEQIKIIMLQFVTTQKKVLLLLLLLLTNKGSLYSHIYRKKTAFLRVEEQDNVSSTDRMCFFFSFFLNQNLCHILFLLSLFPYWKRVSMVRLVIASFGWNIKT